MKHLIFILFLSSFLARAQPPVIIHETFDKNIYGWFEGESDHYKVHIQNGKYFMQSPEGGWMTYLAPYTEKNKDFSLQATFVQTEGVENNGIGFIWGYDGKSEMNNFTFTTSGYYRIWCGDK